MRVACVLASNPHRKYLPSTVKVTYFANKCRQVILTVSRSARKDPRILSESNYVDRPSDWILRKSEWPTEYRSGGRVTRSMDTLYHPFSNYFTEYTCTHFRCTRCIIVSAKKLCILSKAGWILSLGRCVSCVDGEGGRGERHRRRYNTPGIEATPCAPSSEPRFVSVVATRLPRRAELRSVSSSISLISYYSRAHLSQVTYRKLNVQVSTNNQMSISSDNFRSWFLGGEKLWTL